MAQIFISYKRSDLKRVSQVVDEIKRRTDVDCWIDLEGIESGDQFQKVIINAINSADIVIAMLSRDFIKPYTDPKTGLENPEKQSFTEKEVMYALHHDKRFVPLSIDGTRISDCEWLDFNCSGLDCIEWKIEEQREKLFSNIGRWLNVNLPEKEPKESSLLSKWKHRFEFSVIKSRKGCVISIAFVLAACFLIPMAVLPPDSAPGDLEPVYDEKYSSETQSYTEQSPVTEPETEQIAHAIDLGLPSGTLWADRNIGATSTNDYGVLYAWGEIMPKVSYYQNDYNDPGKYNICGSTCDVATVKWGKEWQMPTKELFNELINNCSWKWVSRGSICGYEITGKNGNKIYLPACGWNRQTTIEYRGQYGYYWTGERDKSKPQFAYGILFGRSNFKMGHVYLYFGRSVRAVSHH